MNTKKTKSAFNILALFFLLVVLPGGSIFYLSKGFQHQKETYAELKDYGTVPSFSLRSHQNQLIKTADLKGKIIAAEFTTLETLKNTPLLQQNIENLNSQFGDRKELVIVSYLKDKEVLSAEDLRFLQEKIKLKNPNQWLILTNQNNQIQKLATDYHLPQVEKPSFALVDTSLMIRHYYDAMNREEVGNLAKHIAMILPRQKDKDAILKREKEK